MFTFLNCDAGFAFLKLRFNNFNIALGATGVNYPIRFPEVQNYSQTEIKSAFLIDMRFDFETYLGLRFSPSAQWWSWGEFPEFGSGETENSISGLDVNFDIHYFLSKGKRFSPYVGTGLGLHLTYSESQFPYNLFEDIALVVTSITEYRFKRGVNIMAGSDIRINDNVTLFGEIRYDYAHELNQIKFLIGISTF